MWVFRVSWAVAADNGESEGERKILARNIAGYSSVKKQ